MSTDTFRGRAVPAEPQLGSGGEPLRPQPMSAEVIAAYEAGFKAGQEAKDNAACLGGVPFGTRVRHDLAEHPFFGFAAGCNLLKGKSNAAA